MPQKNQCLINVQTSIGLDSDTLNTKKEWTETQNHIITSHQTSNKCISSLNSTWICQILVFEILPWFRFHFRFVLSKEQKVIFQVFVANSKANQSELYLTLKIKNEISYSHRIKWQKFCVRFWCFRIQFPGQIDETWNVHWLAGYTGHIILTNCLNHTPHLSHVYIHTHVCVSLM